MQIPLAISSLSLAGSLDATYCCTTSRRLTLLDPYHP